MSLRILFADDSVTAQNMGRKILTEAGYEVVAVSNGAAAVKKIAEQKPDIIIVDVYMPGYTGLEVCEKVRGSVETLKTPVLLTVGKMEPYKPEEASRVRADGVIVKPFEASDLLAIVKKFEERIGQEPLVPQPAAVPRLHQSETEEMPAEHVEPIVARAPQATVDVPDHMATSSAFSDLLGIDSAHSMNSFNSPPPAAREVAPPPLPTRAPIPEYDVPVSWREQDGPAPEPFSAAVPATEDEIAPPESSAHPLQIPVYEEREETPAPAEMVPTTMRSTGDIEIPRDPELQETAAEQTRSTVADAREPGLVPTLNQESAPAPESAPSFAEVASGTPAEPPTEEMVAVAAHGEAPAQVPVPAPEVVGGGDKSATSEADFEARVAAAMAAYSNTPEPHTTEESAVAADVQSEGASYHPDYHPPEAYTEPASETEVVPEAASQHVLSEPNVAQSAPAPAPDPAPAETRAAVAASLEAAVPQAAAAAAGTGADHQTIAQAVHRVMERLKPELVDEILRELKSKD